MLDTYFKSYFWSFILGVLFLAAFLLARTVTTVVGAQLAPAPERIAAGTPDAKAKRPGEDGAKTAPLAAFLERNVFEAMREDLLPEPEQPETPDNDGPFNPDQCDASGLGVTLVATIVAKDPEASIAMFTDNTAQESVGYRTGEKVLDQAEVMLIEARNVYVKRNGRCEAFTLEEKGKTTVASAPPPPAEMPGEEGPGSELGKDIKKVSESEYEIPRSDIDSALSNLNQLATAARIVPSFQNGKANGFKLFSIRPNSLYSKIGIQNGDIVQKINGFEINSPDKALEIYSKLKDAQSITVDLIRRGKNQTLSYSIR